MKTSPKLWFTAVACMLLALAGTTKAADTYFQVAQGTNPAYAIWATGDYALDNPSGLNGTAVYPANYLDMPFFNPSTGACAFRCFADTSVAKGMYYVGYYSGGDAYLTVY